MFVKYILIVYISCVIVFKVLNIFLILYINIYLKY